MPQTFNVGARSIFVTVTAWVFIVLGALASASSLVQQAFVVSLATLASAIGLLLRLDWARRVFIGLLAFAIVANLLGLWLQHEMVRSVVADTLSQAPLPPQAVGVFGGFVTAARVMAVVVTLGACALLAWIIRRLMSPAVRQEFA